MDVIHYRNKSKMTLCKRDNQIAGKKSNKEGY